MPSKNFTADGNWNSSVDGRSEAGYRTLAYSGSLGGGTLKLSSVFDGGIEVPISDGELNATMLDDNNDPIQQVTFQSIGTIKVTLSGSTAPTCTVIVL